LIAVKAGLGGATGAGAGSTTFGALFTLFNKIKISTKENKEKGWEVQWALPTLGLAPQLLAYFLR
jgi:hypothetical protein